ncbi:hypothetical protein [Deinococcus murrayi]|uniref:hypothetical protein n=1 Tax=Deinococcus murrayi TaxID=68910 RepID=UPI000485EA4B|nr:hypothetical protein [Deinococcus murrayi]
MKRIILRTADDTADLNPYAGELDENGTLLQSGLLKNTGDVTLTSVRLRVSNNSALPATLSATVNGVQLAEDAEREVLTEPLPPGESVPVLLTWTAGGALIAGEDSGVILGSVS